MTFVKCLYKVVECEFIIPDRAAQFQQNKCDYLVT